MNQPMTNQMIAQSHTFFTRSEIEENARKFADSLNAGNELRLQALRRARNRKPTFLGAIKNYVKSIV